MIKYFYRLYQVSLTSLHMRQQRNVFGWPYERSPTRFILQGITKMKTFDKYPLLLNRTSIRGKSRCFTLVHRGWQKWWQLRIADQWWCFRYLVTNKAGRLGIYDQLSHCNLQDSDIILNELQISEKLENYIVKSNNNLWARRIGRESYKERDILFNFYVDSGFKAWIFYHQLYILFVSHWGYKKPGGYKK